MSAALEALAYIIQRESGIQLKQSQLPSLQAAVTRIDRSLTAEELLARTLSAETLRRLIDEITIRETFFFRHPSELNAIDWHSTLEAARERGSNIVRVWVAGCASGEEAYTIAILACEAFACVSAPVRVLATDIASTALEQAMQGRYGKRSTRTIQAGVRDRYFTTEAGIVNVGERLRALVEFRRHNLVRDPIPPSGEQPFDVILCRNVLIYFDQPTVERVLKALEGALAPAGLLLLGAADRLSGHRHDLPVPRSHPTGRLTQPGPSVRRTPRAHASRRWGAPPRASTRNGAVLNVEPSSPGVGQPDKRPQRLRPTATEAMRAADRGELDLAVRIAQDALAEDPLDSQAHFIRGMAELARDDARAAVEPLRRALYIDPNFGLAAFKLASAHDALGETEPARRAYERTLRTLDHCAAEQTEQPEHLDLIEIAAACHARLRTLVGTRR